MATVAGVAATPQAILHHIRKLTDSDPDFRFMSLNDILQLLLSSRSDFLHHEFSIAARAVDSVIKALDDQNSEVQNLAIKCLGPLVSRIPSSMISTMIDKLSMLKLQRSVDNTIPALALRAVILELPHPVSGEAASPDARLTYDAIQRVLPRLFGPDIFKQPTEDFLPDNQIPRGIPQDTKNITVEAADVLIDLIRCFGPALHPVEVEALLQWVLNLLEDCKGSIVVKKRCVVAVSMLAVYLSDKQLEDIIQRLISGLSRADLSPPTRRLYIYIFGSLARSIPSRIAHHLAQSLSLVLQTLSEEELQNHMERLGDGENLGQDFNDMREAALVTVEAFLASCPSTMRPYTNEILAVSLRYMQYDPNYATDDVDDVEMDGDDEDTNNDNDDTDDEEYENDDDFDDDDDASWKVRRCAVKVLYTLIATRGSGDLMESGILYGQAAPALVKGINEREENVRLEIIQALSLLVRETGEGLNLLSLPADDLDTETASRLPSSRKRRRQSSGGSVGSIRFEAASNSSISDIPKKVPRADLAKLTPSITKITTKRLRNSTVATKQAILNLFNDLVSVQRGSLAESLPDIVRPAIAEAKASITNSSSFSLAAAGGLSIATPSTLRIAALRLLGNLCKTHSSMLLQPYLSDIVAAVTIAVHDKSYRITSDAIRTSEELIKAVTPPRSQEDGAKNREEVAKLFDVIMEQTSASEADAEVRQRAIHALGTLVSRTSISEGSGLLLAEEREAALNTLRERLNSETTRFAAVRALSQMVALANRPDQLDGHWIQNVALELSAQLRKANSSLRAASASALKHLILSNATKDRLQQSTVKCVVSALMPAITDTDTHLLGPGLLILATLIRHDAALVLENGLVAALCQLMKSHLAGIVIEQLLELIGQIGHSGSGRALMQGLLELVSMSGDPWVVGKVIGTLLVTGGESTGVTLDSFVKELQKSSRSGDEARIVLALAVLGEAGMRLGRESPLRPDLFLEQFHSEPDKTSLSAAVALGRAASGNSPVFLPVILKNMQKKGNTDYLLIQSIKKYLQSISADLSDLRGNALLIWGQLLDASSTADNRVICAECAGRIAILDATFFMPKLEALLLDASPSVRSMAVQAVRFTLSEADETFDAILKDSLMRMLFTMLQDSEMEIKRLAMSTLNSAAHNKAELISPHIAQLVPFVLNESSIKPELIKEVMLGPFKHKVDDGLEVRKSAYETLYALMETAYTRLNNIDFYDQVMAGLKDDNDIRQLCNLMVSKLVVIDPDETVRRLDSIAEAYRSVLSVKLKEKAVKQDIEKQEEANKSVLRVTLILGDKMKAMIGNAAATLSNAGAISAWAAYWEWVNREFQKQLQTLREESSQLQTRMV